jgi:hypothetical protein
MIQRKIHSYHAYLFFFCDFKEEEQVRAAKAMRPKRPTMEMTDNHQSRSIGDIHSFLNANNNQQYNLLTFCRREAAAEWMFPMLPKMISEFCQEFWQQQIKTFPA